MPYAKGRWVDQNGRSHNWSGDVASNDRNQIKTQIYSQTGARDVIISSVTETNSSDYDDRRRQHIAEENERRQEQLERLESGKSSYSNSYSDNNYDYSDSSSESSMDAGSVAGLVLIVGVIWAFITFMPWILMVAGGAGGSWISEKLTGQTVDEYTNTKDPTDEQNKKALITLCSALLLGGFGFIQGTLWQNDVNKDNNSNQPKVEEVRQK